MIRSYHRFRFRSVERNVHHLCCHSKLKVSAGWYASNHPYPHKAQSTIENISSAGELLTYPGLAIIVQESCVSSDQYSGNELYIISHSSPPSSSQGNKDRCALCKIFVDQYKGICERKEGRVIMMLHCCIVFENSS